MAVTTIKNTSALKPTTSGWQPGFRTKGLGFVVMVPCDTRYYNVAVSGTAKVFLPASGWVDLKTGTWAATAYGSYYLLVYTGGNEISDSLTDSVYLVSITVNATAK